MKPQFHPITLAIFLIPILIVISGCSTLVPQPTPTMIPNTLTENDNGKIINLNTSDIMVVRLPSNPSTGYTWEVQDLDDSVLEQLGDAEFESVDTAPNLVGAGGTLVMTFRAIAPGTVVLTLVYHRPWEVDVLPIQTFSVTVTVK